MIDKVQIMINLFKRTLLILIVGLSLLALYPTRPVVVTPGAMGPYLNGIFTPEAPGEGLSFTLEDPLPGQTFYGPIRIIPFLGTEDILLLGKRGMVWRINLEDQAAESVLNISDRCFGRGDAGAVGLALHPRFAATDATDDEKVIFIYYRSKPQLDEWSELGYNRLSKFRWDDNAQAFDPESEEILIQQYDRSTWHNGGDLFFGPEDGFLYFSVGDEGHEEFIEDSNQRLDGGFFTGVFRIDVDNNPARSHPIIRQPRPLASPPDGWPETFSQGYSIPNDNPWPSPDGAHLEEYFALGLRSPYTMRYDAETDDIWVADVGAGDMEEISIVERGGNMQWPYKEGTLNFPGFERPDDLIGNEITPILAYDREFGRSITGGEVYRGDKFPGLYGKYLFSDFHSNRLMAIDAVDDGSQPDLLTLVGDLRNEHPDIPSGAGVTGIYPQANGDILITVLGSRMEAIPGKIFRIQQRNPVPEPPARLSDLGVFADMVTLETNSGILPYRTNSPLWSDRALKRRWLILPNDGSFDTSDEQIDFSQTGEWDFPEGSVFIKHFELPLTTDPNVQENQGRRLETRFYIVGPQSSYGLSYHWNEEGTEAFLANGSDTEDFEVIDHETGAVAYVQTWEFPGRAQCSQCHTAAAGFTLGLNTHQLNGELRYPDIGNVPINQLTYLSELGAFRQDIPAPEELPRAFAIEDESAGLDVRVRSYLDANCASCHRPGGITNLGMDLRFNTELPFTNIVNVAASSHNSDPNRMIVRPGSHQDSELWHRDDALDGSKMPPLSKQLRDEPYLEKLAEWIDGLNENAGQSSEDRIYPNPFGNLLSIRLRDDRVGPFEVELYNSNGQRLYQAEFTNRNFRIETGLLPPGVYVVVMSSDGERMSWRVVKQ
ncbi:hypothetical protein CEQ90_05225 [Lewinellaceae bacterium SD302]|nr:hypothetical protein CEQ90_05225 [Lewinellaceae bacterium SD302]